MLTRKKRTIEEMHALAYQKGGKCLSTKYTNTKTKLKWQCKEGHQWDSQPTNIIQGSWCPQCHYNSQKHTIEEMHALANQKEGKCLSIYYILLILNLMNRKVRIPIII